MDAPVQTPLGRTRGQRLPWLLLAASVAVLLSRALFLPPTLEDIDSVNFALALERFDPRLHQPHPPGYPVYVLLARVVHAVIPDPPRALGLLSALAQAALVLPLFALFSRLSSTPGRAALSTLLVLCCPILWFNGARPMSDSVGLLFVISSQALLLRSLDKVTTLPAASLVAGLALGVRLQTGALTIPLWLFAVARTRKWRAPVAALAGGILLWGIPLVIASGGPAEYARAFAQTMGDAAGSEPVMVGFTLNRAARALVKVAIAPWVSPILGGFVTTVAGIGFLAVARRRPATLALASLAFVPYLIIHTLVQQVETVRYSLPYVPWIAWLTVEGLGFLGEHVRSPVHLERAIVGGVVTASAALTFPALALYHVWTSPPYAALAMVESQAVEPAGWTLGGHYMFWRYFRLRPEGMEVLSATPGQAMPRLSRHFRTGDHRKVMFLADPRRTDLVTLSRGAARLLGRWEWPAQIRPFLSGARPNEAELFAIDRPLFFSGEGWLLSLESGRIEDTARDPRREAYLKSMRNPSFLLLAGIPTGPAEGCVLDMEVPGLLDGEAPCGGPLARGYLLPPADAASIYLRLSAVSRRGEAPAGMPFALEGLDYGPIEAAGFVHAEGWFFPEKDEDLRPFRWASPRARSLLHIPAVGARLIVEGIAPIEYLGADLSIEISENGATLATARLNERRFHLEAVFKGGDQPFHEIVLSTNRSFVPDAIQKNGDLRLLALRVYEFNLLTAASEPIATPGGRNSSPRPGIAGKSGPE